MFVKQCYVYKPLLCLWTSAMFVNQCYVYEPVLCLLNKCYVYEPLLCLWTSAMFVNPCFSCEPVLHLPLMMTVWFSKCLAASQAVFRHWETQLNHLVPSKEENQEISCTAKSFPESERGKVQQVTFSGGYWSWSHLGIQGICYIQHSWVERVEIVHRHCIEA